VELMSESFRVLVTVVQIFNNIIPEKTILHQGAHRAFSIWFLREHFSPAKLLIGLEEIKESATLTYEEYEHIKTFTTSVIIFLMDKSISLRSFENYNCSKLKTIILLSRKTIIPLKVYASFKFLDRRSLS
tara:strand:+ start:1001 stop:1390 length:390 start_codon:yes stop_codon:yes gene_type:complete